MLIFDMIYLALTASSQSGWIYSPMRFNIHCCLILQKLNCFLLVSWWEVIWLMIILFCWVFFLKQWMVLLFLWGVMLFQQLDTALWQNSLVNLCIIDSFHTKKKKKNDPPTPKKKKKMRNVFFSFVLFCYIFPDWFSWHTTLQQWWSNWNKKLHLVTEFYVIIPKDMVRFL